MAHIGSHHADELLDRLGPTFNTRLRARSAQHEDCLLDPLPFELRYAGLAEPTYQRPQGQQFKQAVDRADRQRFPGSHIFGNARLQRLIVVGASLQGRHEDESARRPHRCVSRYAPHHLRRDGRHACSPPTRVTYLLA